MANIKPEESETSIWQGYHLQPPHPSTSHPPPFDSNFTAPALSIPYHHQRPQKGGYRSLDIPSIQTRPALRDGNGVLTASPPTLNTHHSYPSLKRGFHSGDGLPYVETVQDFREELPVDPKPAINQDHRLLCFARLPEKRTILNSQGQVQQIDLAAQIHGMFFLSELATPSNEPHLVQPELTCYRRNLFQISGNVTTPRGPISLITERNERVAIVSLEVSISATESVDGHVVKLIVIPWKTPPPNSPEVGPGQESEPTPIPLEPFDNGREATSDFTVYPIAYRRLQFRIATANNGRRRELQQHFTLHLNVVGTLANGTKTNVCETSTAPIVVRGRSPRNFQARKEIPLVGSSSSRGQPPELHVTTANMPISLASEGKSKSLSMSAMSSKSQTLELPRSPFTFDSSTIAGSPSLIRQSTYPSWNAQHNPDHSTAPATPNYPAPPVGLDNYLHVNQSNSDLAHSTSHSSSATTATSHAPMRQQYAYHPASAPATGGPNIRFIDSNPRPTKSPRHIAPPELPPTTYPDYASTRFAPPYSGPGDAMPTRSSDYFPPPVSMQSWTTAPESGPVYGTSSQAPPSIQHYQFPSENQYPKEEGTGQQHYTWNSGVRRSDIYSRSRSSSPASESDQELEKQLQERLARLYGAVESSPPDLRPAGSTQQLSELPLDHGPINRPEDEEENDGGNEFEFRLFSTPAVANISLPVQKITLDSEEDEIGDGGFVVTQRERSYYSTPKAEGERKHRFEATALSGEEIMKLKERRAWGLEVPWRVRVLKVHGKTESGAVELVPECEEKRKRPGKKCRILLRERQKKREEKEAMRKKELELQEETEKEKRTRRNRERKVKRRLKEKAEKAKKAEGGSCGIILEEQVGGADESGSDKN